MPCDDLKICPRPRWTQVLLPLLFMQLSSAFSQPIFTLDQAAFRQKGGLVYLEVYLMAQRDGLKFVPADSGFQALLNVTLDLYSGDSLLSSTGWEVVDNVAKLEDITPRQKLPDIAIFPQLAPGSYKIQGKIHDVQADTTYSRSLDLNLKAFSDTALCLSAIELANRLEKTATKSKFWKNEYLVVPNPERLYGLSVPTLFYYTEIYNLKDTTGSFLVDRIILNSEHQEVKRLPQKVHKKVGPSAVKVEGIPVASLETGTYFLRLLVEDSDAGTTATQEAKFFVFQTEGFAVRSAPPVQTLSADEVEISTQTDAEVEAAVEELKYLLNDAQWRSLSSLTPDGKRQFLIRFWRERDPDPSTAVNEFHRTFMERKEYADQKFGYLGREGWKTDRGRVYILYGVADKVDFHTHELDTRPYEIWYYDAIEGGVMFVFVDRNNFGDFRLVHSTKSGELYRQNWFEQEAAVRRQ
jgi:GWxTD domain-containing protein